MAALTVQTAVRAGIVPTMNAVSSADEFTNSNGDVIIWVVNGSGGSLTVTAVTQTTIDSLAVADLTVSIANGATKVIGPFPTAYYNDANSKVQLQFSATTSVTCAVIQVP